MYSSDIKSCVSLNGDCSTFFYCKNGLSRENLSPILFSLSLNYLESFLLRENIFGVNIFVDWLQCYLKRVFLPYADDMVLFAKSMEELQDLYDKFKIYCLQWKLKVNSETSKVVIL